MRNTARTNAKRKLLSVRELREHYIEQGCLMSGPFKNIDIKLRTDQYGGFYSAVDLAGRAWKITNFSLAGIWVMWPPQNSNRSPIYVHSLYEADIILNGGVVLDKEIKKPERTSTPSKDKKQTYYFDNMADFRIEEAKKQQQKKAFEERIKRRNSL